MSGHLRVAVIYGGRSGEHEISLRSAESVMSALRASGHDVIPYFIAKSGKWHPAPILPEPGSNDGIDVVFPVLHGTFGEDGTVQGLLELSGVPYVGPGVLGSAVAMDKVTSKRLLREQGLPVADYQVAYRGNLDPMLILDKLPLPLFVKPANLGSSVGISKVKYPHELPAALELAAQFDRKILIERGIVARELECAVLGNQEPIASAPCEVHPSREFYDYEDKYLLESATFDNPATLSEEMTTQIQRIAVQAFQCLGCEGMARVDFLLDEAAGIPYINEVNTIPGFTSISMYPKMWEAAGVTMPQLVDSLLRLALERDAQRQTLRYER